MLQSTTTVGRFTFTVLKGLAIPADAAREERSNELPFKAMFSGMEHNDCYHVPASFWTAPRSDGGRGVPPAKATVGYQREKLRTAFKSWVAKAPQEREWWSLVIVPRKGGEAPGIAEAGLSFFLLDRRRVG